MATAPSSVTASRVPGNPTQISVSWTAGVAQIVGNTVSYRVQRSINFGSYSTIITSTTLRSTTRTEAAGNSYRYRVASLETPFVNSSYTVSNSLTLPPATPSSITVNRDGQLDRLNVSWSSSTGATGYDVQRREGSGNWNLVSSKLLTFESYGGLTRGSTYTFRVRAKNSGGDSAYRESSSVTLVPFRPSSVSASLSGDTSIRVTWPAANGATSYRVRRSVNGGSYSDVEITSGTDRTYSSLTRGSTYTFTVWSRNAGGESPTSRESNSVQIPFPPPSAPSSASISKNKRDVTISLGTASAPSGTSISSYEIEIRDSGGSYGSRRSVSTSDRSTTYTGLNPGVTYQGRGRAIGTGGAGDWTESGTVTISSPPSIPFSISATRSFRNVFVDLGISTAADDVTISGYEIQRRESTDAGATWGSSVITDTVDRTTTYTNLNALSTYQFRGRALSDFNPGEFRTSDAIFIPGFPDPPQQVLALQEGASIQVILTTPISDGGTPILTYRIEKRVSQDLGTTWSSWDDPVIVPGNEPVYLYEGLVLQKTYQFRALSTNSEGDSENFTESEEIYLPAIVKIRDEGVFRLTSDYKRYDEDIGAWIGLSTYKRYFNGQWVNLE